MAGPLTPLRVALAQVNSRVGDIEGNARKIREWIARARERGAELVLVPELAVTGYPPEDLLLKEHFLAAAREATLDIAKEAEGIVALVGTPERVEDVYNALAVMADGEVQALYRKNWLPNYGVFDEQRYFQAGDQGAILDIGGVRVGLTVCEDIWVPGQPESDEATAGATLIVNASASPYFAGKGRQREAMVVQRARDNLCAFAFCNMVGGQDELIFDGHSLVLDEEGRVLARARGFEEALLVVDIDPADAVGRRLRDVRRRALARDRGATPDAPVTALGPVRDHAEPARPEPALQLGELEQMRLALELGLGDYVGKNGFSEIVIGVSGGIDSALTAALAVEALGPERVHCVSMPSRYSSEETRRDARLLAESLGTDFRELPIDDIAAAFHATLAETFAGREPDLAEENIQARIRGVLLMALSNKFGWLVVATGNKSELSVGYATLYGDMAGGFALLKDVFKTDVFRLARHVNERAARELIPQTIIDRAPSAELRDNQLDQDSLPPYDALDRVLEAYVEQDRSREELSQDGFDPDVVERALALIDRAEYKRRQAPPGVRLTPKAFGRDRRTPITNGWRG
ncbi:MAG: NAD+ synthase [Gaiellaceae bacterium]